MCLYDIVAIMWTFALFYIFGLGDATSAWDGRHRQEKRKELE